jgi:hypothetical protein
MAQMPGMLFDNNGLSADEVMGTYKVDVNQGAMIRFDRDTGAAVYMMYSNPGVFLNDHGKRVPPEFAIRAGYEIEPLLKELRKNEARAKALAAIDEQFADKSLREVVAERGEYRVVHLGNQLFVVEFDDGTPMGRPVTEEIAMSTFEMLAGPELVPEKPTKK